MSNIAEVTVEVDAAAELEVRNERVMQNQGLVYQIAHGFKGRGFSAKELVQIGNIGLMRAAEKFDPGRGLRFSTYAVYWIRQSIFKGIESTSRRVRVPVKSARYGWMILKRAKEDGRITGIIPSVPNTVDAMMADGSLPVSERFAETMRERYIAAALAVNPTYCPVPTKEIPAPDAADPLKAAIDAEHREQLYLAVELLPDDLRNVLACRYGLDGSPPLTIDATAALIGIGYKQAARLEYRAIARLKKLLNR